MNDKDELTLDDLPAEVFGKVLENAETGCWEWQMYKNPGGYGQIRVNWKLWLVHRFVYHHCVADIPDGLLIMHSCDNPSCCRPKHLELGTQNQNQQDKIRKGKNNDGERNGMSKLNQAMVDDIRERWDRGETGASIAKLYEVNRSCISKIVNRVHWK